MRVYLSHALLFATAIRLLAGGPVRAAHGQRAKSVPGERTDQILQVRQHDHGAGMFSHI